MNKRTVLYARVSSDDRDNGSLNLTGQLDTCRSFARQKSYQVIEELAEDVRGVSGAILDSPALQQALQLAAAKKFEVLVVREMDRLARSLAKQLIIEQEFQKQGVEIEYVLESFAPTPEGSLHKNIKAVIAEFERVKIQERTRRGRIQRVKAGNILVHGRPPYGYRVQEHGHSTRLVIHPAEARIVRLIFEWYVYGDEDHSALSARAIARLLSQLGVPCPKRTAHRTTTWVYPTIQQMLRNETYAGVWHYGKFANPHGIHIAHPRDQWLAVPCPSIITHELWDLAQKKRSVHQSFAARRTRYLYLFQHRLTCAECGGILQVRTGGRPQTPHRYYYCPNARPRNKSARACSSKAFYRAREIDATIWNWLRNYLSNDQRMASSWQQVCQHNQAVLSPIQDRLKVIENLLSDDRDQLKKLTGLYIDGAFTKASLLERTRKLENHMADLAAEFAQLGQRVQASSYVLPQVEKFKQFIEAVPARLAAADRHPDHQRKIIEFLDVKAALESNAGKRTAKVIFALGQTILDIESIP